MWSPISKWLARHPKAAQSTFLSATLTLGICLLIYYNASEISVAKRTVLTTTTSSPAFVTAFVQNLSSNIGAIISSKLESRTVDVDSMALCSASQLGSSPRSALENTVNNYTGLFSIPGLQCEMYSSTENPDHSCDGVEICNGAETEQDAPGWVSIKEAYVELSTRCSGAELSGEISLETLRMKLSFGRKPSCPIPRVSNGSPPSFPIGL